MIDKDGLMKFSEGLDGRVLEKVIVALEARLTEHVGQVDRRLAEIDAQVALDLKAVDTHTAAQTSAVEKAIQQIEAEVRDYVAAAQQSSAEQIAGVDQKLVALQDALPAKFREIIEAVRQSMEARLALELKEIEDRVAAGRVAPEQLQELESNVRGEVEALAGRLTADLHGLAEHQQSQTAPLQQALQQLETKLTTLREELPPKIRQIVEAVEASMDARISAGDQQAAGRMNVIEQALAGLRADFPGAGAYQQAIDENLRRHAEQVGALDQKLTVLQEELPPKIKAIVDAVRESLDARLAVELQGVEERHAIQIQRTEDRLAETQQQLRQQLAADSKTDALEQDLTQLRADLRAAEGRIETSDRRGEDQAAGVAAGLESLQVRHRAEIEQVEARLRATFSSEIHNLEARTPDHSPELEKALQYTSLLEARVQALEQKLQQNAAETVERAVERVWQALETRLQQRQAAAPPAPPPETLTGLRQKSTSAEQSVLDLIAGIGQLFEKPPQRAVRPEPEPEPPAPEPPAPEAPAPVAAVEMEPEPVVAETAAPEPEPMAQVEPEPVAEAHVEAEAVEPVHMVAEPVASEPGPAHTEPVADPEPLAFTAAVMPEPVAEKTPEMAEAPPPVAPYEEPGIPPLVATAVEDGPEPALEEKPPVILFRPKESGRKWRIPFVSSFLLMAVALAWLQFM
ncbi:MAG TPA: hypothetical protein VKR61_24370 [Bryobacteraceae bacterium]|nr:hypothetical protein [Bryobacteraceae bacterium]